jgi:2-polyprenyl-3-methyl-5-hydroxy-6-metoxy-1,4-benzoquinol methylase
VSEDNREYDQTQLKLAQFKYQPHKDYLGHIFRWGFASKFVNQKTSVLDVGCGQEMPFARSLGGANPNSVPSRYLGVDLNGIKTLVNRKNFEVWDEFNFVEDWECILAEGHKPFDVIVNFEVFEHMKMGHGRKLLSAMRELLARDGVLIFSTPIYCSTYKQARNHINELTKAEIEEEIQKAGLKIIKQYGTFANINDIKKVASKEDLDSHKAMSEFYGNEILGCYLSPKYPEASRNITHICVRKKDKRKAMKLKPSIVKFEGEKVGKARNK